MSDNQKKQEKKRKLPIWAKILLIFLAVILAAAAVMAGIALHTFGKIKLVKSTDQQSVVAPEDETFEEDSDLSDAPGLPMDPEEVQWPADLLPYLSGDDGTDTVDRILRDKNVVNIMLIGQDRREGEGRQRSDTMILVTVNKKEQTIQLTSFMRDLYVQIPGYSDNRMNAAYQFGGMELLDQVVEKNFGIHVDGNVEVDFEGFSKCIDMVGGVDIDLSQAEADYICGRKRDVLYPQTRREEWDYLTAGVNTLNGEQALIHARNRSIGHSDYERTERQREVLQALFAKAKGSGIGTILSLVNQGFSLMTTDMSRTDILKCAFDVFSMGVSNVESYRIPQDGAYYDAVIRRMVPDLDKCRAYLRENLY